MNTSANNNATIRKVLSFVVKFRWALFIAILFALLFLAPYIRKATVPNNSLKIWFLQTDPLLKTYDEFHEKFGNDEIILLKLDAQEGVLTTNYLKWLDGLVKKIEKVEGVFQVHSVLSAQDSYESEDGLDFNNLISSLDSNQEDLDNIFQNALKNPLVKDKFIDTSGKQCMLWIELDVSDDFDDKRSTIVHSITKVLEDYIGKDRFALGGLSIIYTALNDISQKEIGLFFGICFMLIFIAITWIFRDWRLILATIGVIMTATSLTFGIYGIFGHQINLMTVMLPIIVIILGITDAIHFPVAYLRISKDHPSLTPFERTLRAFQQVFWPCLLTTFTTAVGFLSLTTAPMAIVSEYGIFTAVGITIAFLSCFIFMSMGFMGLKNEHQPRLILIESILKNCQKFLFRYPAPISISFLLIIIVSLIGALKIKVDTYTLGYFSEKTQVIKDHNFITQTWGDYGNVDCIIRVAENNQIDSSEVTNALEAFIQKVEALPEIRHAFALPLLYRRMEEVFTGESRRHIPMTEGVIDQLNLFLEGEFFVWDKTDPEYKNNVLQPFMSKDHGIARITFISKIISASEMTRVSNTIDQIAQETFGDLAHYELTGYTPLYITIINYIMASQIRSFFLVIGILFIIMWLWTHSLSIALLSLIPNLFPVAIIFGVMGYTGITLDIATAVIAAIVIGVAIDDTIHFLHHWREGATQNLSWKDNVTHTYKRAGRAILLTTLLLLIGFPLMMFSQLKSVAYFGLLTSIAAFSALVADLFLLPLLLRLYTKK